MKIIKACKAMKTKQVHVKKRLGAGGHGEGGGYLHDLQCPGGREYEHAGGDPCLYGLRWVGLGRLGRMGRLGWKRSGG